MFISHLEFLLAMIGAFALVDWTFRWLLLRFDRRAIQRKNCRHEEGLLMPGRFDRRWSATSSERKRSR